MKQAIKSLITKAYARLARFNNPFFFYGIPKDDFVIENQQVRFKKMDLVIDRQTGASIIQGYPYAMKIVSALNAKFTFVEHQLFLQIEDLKFRINSAEELFILYEVFVTEVYNYSSHNDTIFIDIGMNSATTSLFYAKKPWIKKVYAFELFAPTFRLGSMNLSLNVEYSKKVIAANYGLSDKAFDTTLDYSLSRKGRMGLKGLPDDEEFYDTIKEHVVVKDVHDAFTEIIANSQGMDILVKMDCEGEEYNLIKRLSESGLLTQVTAIMIEWHYHRSVEIETRLQDSGFLVFSQCLPSLDSGMIYAARGNRI